MAIPEAQLDTWSHQGAVAGSRDTYAVVKRCLESPYAPYADLDYRVFLQGSYGNDTNIYAESDVDVVIRLDSTFVYDLDALDVGTQAGYRSATPPASYPYVDFKRDVVGRLRECFDSSVRVGNKAVAIEAAGNRRKADVIVAVEFRRYLSFSDHLRSRYTSGICFFTDTNERVVNYPTQHSENMTRRHQASGGWLKPMVRILKNMRRRMESRGLIPEGIAPSYFLEGLIYNVPVDKLGTSYESSFVSAFNWILAQDRQAFVCANEQYALLRDVQNVCWRPAHCDQFLDALVRFWDDWE